MALIKYGQNLQINKVLKWNEFYFNKHKSIVSNKTIGRVASISPIALNPEKYLYVVARAVSGGEKWGPNDNGDYFRWEELLNRYMTFIGSAVNVDHKNDKKEYAIGIIIDALPNEEGQWIEIVMAIDKEKADVVYPGLVTSIENGDITDVSMGCLVEYSICNVCLLSKYDGIEEDVQKGDGLAYDPTEYCEHIYEGEENKEGEVIDPNPDYCKGQRVEIEMKDGTSIETSCYEDNRGVTFFEESVITTQGADKDAKFLEKLASKSTKSSLVPFISFRAIDHVKVSNLRLKHSNLGEETMPAAKVIKKASAEAGQGGSQLDTGKEAGDYGSAEEKNNALYQQSKAKGEKTENGGSQVSSELDRGDYTLASLKKISKKNPKLALAFIEALAEIDEEGKAGEKPATVENKESKLDEEKEEDAEEKVDPQDKEKQADEEEEKDSVKSAGKKVKKGKQVSLGNGIQSKFANLLTALAGFIGNPISTADDKDNAYGSSETINDQTKSGADAGAAATEKEKKSQDSANPETVDGRMKIQKDSKTASVKEKIAALKLMLASEDKEDEKDEKKEATKEDDKKEEKEAAKKHAENEDKKMQHIVSEMNKGVDYDEARKGAEERFGPEEEGAVDSKKIEQASKKTAQDDSEIEKGTKETKESPASISIADKEDKMQDKELGQESAGSSTSKPEDERKISASKEDDKKEVEGKKEDEKEEEKEASSEDKKDDEKKEATKEDDKEEKEASNQAIDIVAKLDQLAEEKENENEEKKTEAKSLASANMKSMAMFAIKQIAKNEKIVAKLNSMAQSIEETLAESNKLKSASLRKSASLSVKAMLKQAEEFISNVAAEDKKDEEENKKVEGSVIDAKAKLSLIAENLKLKKEAAIKDNVLARTARAKSISSLVITAMSKGLVSTATKEETIKKWSSIDDATFAGVKLAIESAPSRSIISEARMKRSIREAAEGLERLDTEGVNTLMSPITAASKQGSNDSLLDKGEMFMDKPLQGVANSY